MGEVGGPVEQPGVGRLAVAAGAAELLVVGVERAGDVRVQDPAHVRLVDAHPERDGGADDPSGAAEERVHPSAALRGGEAGVIQGRAVSGREQHVPRELGARARGRVDDPGAREL